MCTEMCSVRRDGVVVERIKVKLRMKWGIRRTHRKCPHDQRTSLGECKRSEKMANAGYILG